MGEITFHRVEHPGYVDFQAQTADKIEGNGFNYLGRRHPKFICWHRMWGTLRGTDSAFGNPNFAALTDYGIGSANIDGDALDGVIHKYNDPLGWRSGWASGRVSSPYGDGACIVNKYGVNAVNRDGVSVETSGWNSEPFTDFAWSELVRLFAYWIDYMEIPYDSLPLNPHTGCNAIVWHQEFTIGTGKECPFDWMMAHTNQMYDDIAAYLKPIQTGAGAGTVPDPDESEPTPQYAAPVPIPELAQYADDDADSIAAVVSDDAHDFIFVGDQVQAVRDVPRRQYAFDGAKHTGPVITEGATFEVAWMVTTRAGEQWYITPWWTRVPVAATRRIGDSPATGGGDLVGNLVNTLEDVVAEDADA